jgi:hypothetical protein
MFTHDLKVTQVIFDLAGEGRGLSLFTYITVLTLVLDGVLVGVGPEVIFDLRKRRKA